MRKSLLLKHAIAFIIFLVVFTLLTPVVKSVLEHSFKDGQNDWIGYAGNIVGGILGGISTFLGVSYAFNLERNRAFLENIPTKVVSIYNLTKQVSSNELKKNYNDSQSIEEARESCELFFGQLEDFYSRNQRYLEEASSVDTHVFAAIERYYEVMNIIRSESPSRMEKDNSLAGINEEMAKVTTFYLNITEIVLAVMQERKDYYMDLLHKQKNPQDTIEKFNNHAYLSEIFQERKNRDGNN